MCSREHLDQQHHILVWQLFCCWQGGPTKGGKFCPEHPVSHPWRTSTRCGDLTTKLDHHYEGQHSSHCWTVLPTSIKTQKCPSMDHMAKKQFLPQAIMLLNSCGWILFSSLSLSLSLSPENRLSGCHVNLPPHKNTLQYSILRIASYCFALLAMVYPTATIAHLLSHFNL